MPPILFVSPTPFSPSDAGNRVRIGNLVRALAQRGYAPHFLHVERERGDAQAMAEVVGAAQFRHIPYHRPQPQLSRPARLQHRLRRLLRPESRYLWALDDWYDPAITTAVVQWHKERQFAAVIVEYVFFSALLEALPADVLKIIDTHDRFALRHQLYLQRGMEPRFFSTSPADEARGLSRADVVLAIQEQERSAFSQITQAQVITVGHLVSLEDCYRADRNGSAVTLLIVGSDNELNVDGLQWFLTACWPAVQRVFPDAQVHVAGGLSKAAPATPGIVPMGYVDDVAKAYRGAHIAINPVRSGTGLNIKSIEALGYGVPLITTHAGGRGLPAQSPPVYLTADTPHEMVHAISTLWASHQSAHALASRGQACARQWNDATFQELVNTLSGLPPRADHAKNLSSGANALSARNDFSA